MHLPNRKTPRAPRHDYTSPGAYFITICTKDREHYFGEVEKGKIVLNALGTYTTEHRKYISNHYPFVVCDEFMCMPNHIHGILIIWNNPNRTGTKFLSSSSANQFQRTYKNTSLANGIQPKSWSLGAIVRWFKIGITKYAKQHTIPFKRQSRYHDYIIKDEKMYTNIKQYIINNPKNRKEDRFWK